MARQRPTIRSDIRDKLAELKQLRDEERALDGQGEVVEIADCLQELFPHADWLTENWNSPGPIRRAYRRRAKQVLDAAMQMSIPGEQVIAILEACVPIPID